MPPRRKRISDDSRHAIAERDDWECVYCEEELDWDNLAIDHKTPLSRGGTDHPDNLQATCFECNEEKGNKTHAEYLSWLDEQDDDEDEWDDDDDEDWDDDEDDDEW